MSTTRWYSKLSKGKAVAAIVSAVGALGFVFVLSALPAGADVDPGGCTDNGGGISLAAFRSDGTTNIGGGTVIDGESIKYKATLFAAPPPNCAFEGGTWTLTTPDGVVHALGAVPRVGGTGVASFASALIPYTVTHANEGVGATRHVDASTAYSGGNSHADASDATAGPTLGASKVVPVIHTPVVTTDIHDAGHGIVLSVPAGTTVHDSAAVTGEGGGPVPAGTVTFTRYTDTNCGSGATAAGVVALNGSGIAHPSNAFLTTSSGGMSYKAHYNGQANVYAEADGPCEPLTITKLTPTVTTDIHDAAHAIVTAVNAGATVHDSATVSGSSGTPTGTVDFAFYTSGDCTTGSSASGSGIALNGSGFADPSTSQGPLAAGSYSFKAHYNGDGVYDAADGPCEPLTVNQVASQWCSHGYWKQKHHFDSWVGYLPNQLFSSVFDNAFPGKTLLQVLQQGGGGLNALGRDTVGELLNSAAGLNNSYTTAEVVSMFNAAYPGTAGAYSTLHAQFVGPENCPLN
jgi:hypothetical protein